MEARKMKCKLLFIGSVVLIIVLSGAVDTTSGDAAASTVLGSGAGSLTEPALPDTTCPPDGQCFADVPASNPFYTFINRIYQQDLVTGYPCGGFAEPCDPENRPYYRPITNVTRQQMAKFIDNARRLPEIHIQTSSVTAPIYISNTAGSAIYGASVSAPGVLGSSNGYFGVFGLSINSVGVRGQSTNSIGVWGSSTSDVGVRGYSTNDIGVWGGTGGTSSTDYGVYASAFGSAQAGHFDGNVQVVGSLSKGGGSFKIDHPLDPENKYLYHSFVESPDMMNVYNGNVTTDARGEAIVILPDWFEALNKDFRYQLTIMGDQFAQARISSKIKDNHFTIMTDKPTIEVSWQVTGIRQDPYANAHRIPVEEDKPANERGKYLHPTEWGQPTSLGVDYERQQSLIADQQDSGQDNH
jgi:hypothetical protein